MTPPKSPVGASRIQPSGERAIDLTVDEPFFSDDLLQPPPATVGEGVAVMTSPIAPPVVGLAELEASATSQAGLELALVFVPAIRPDVLRLGDSYAVSSSTGTARSLADPDSEALGDLAEGEDSTCIDNLSPIASVRLTLQAMGESIMDDVLPAGKVPFNTCCSATDVLPSC